MQRWAEAPTEEPTEELTQPPGASTEGRVTIRVTVAVIGTSIVATMAWQRWWYALAAAAVATFALVQARSVSSRVADTVGRAGRGLRRAPVGAVRLLGRSLGLVALIAAFAFFVIPVFVVTLPFHRRPFGVPRGVDGWVSRHGSASKEVVRAGGTDRPRVPIPARRLLARAALLMAMLFAVDIAAGSVLSGTGLMPGEKGAFLEAQRWLETSMESPVIRDEPWAEQYTEEGLRLFSQRQEYVPFLVFGFLPFQSEHINTTERERLSYVPASLEGARPLRVAFFGGSVMWGVGQRDEHTIPSAFARAAEVDGVPVEVHNYGMYGWVAWQEYQYLERLLAAGERYDLIVFYDGLNDYNVQFSDFSVDPTHGGSKVLEHFGAEIHDDLYTAPGYLDGPRALFDAYRDHSGLARVVDELTGPDSELPIWMRSEIPVEPTARRAALDVYGRSQRAVVALADDHDIPVRFFFQAIASGWDPELLAQLPPHTVDTSDVLDGVEDEVYLDGGHTNERGARIVAERLWREVRPVLDAAPAGEGDNRG